MKYMTLIFLLVFCTGCRFKVAEVDAIGLGRIKGLEAETKEKKPKKDKEKNIILKPNGSGVIK